MEEGEEKDRKKKRRKKYCHGEGGLLWGWTHFAACAVGHSS
jgi:hypothetical protein